MVNIGISGSTTFNRPAASFVLVAMRMNWVDANALDDRLNQRLGIVAIEGAIGDDPSAVRKSECLRPAAEQVAKAGMLPEIVDRPRNSPALKVFRRCAQNILQDTQRATDQVRVFLLGYSDREVETPANEIDTAVRDAGGRA